MVSVTFYDFFSKLFKHCRLPHNRTHDCSISKLSQHIYSRKSIYCRSVTNPDFKNTSWSDWNCIHLKPFLYIHYLPNFFLTSSWAFACHFFTCWWPSISSSRAWRASNSADIHIPAMCQRWCWHVVISFDWCCKRSAACMWITLQGSDTLGWFTYYWCKHINCC